MLGGRGCSYPVGVLLKIALPRRLIVQDIHGSKGDVAVLDVGCAAGIHGTSQPKKLSPRCIWVHILC